MVLTWNARDFSSKLRKRIRIKMAPIDAKNQCAIGV